MKVEEIKKASDAFIYIEGCLNDFESAISTKEETLGLLVDLVIHVVELTSKQ